MIPTERLSKPSTHQSRNDPTPEAFFEEVYRIFLRAEENTAGSVERFYFIGGHIVSVHFAGPALVPLISPALEHLSCAKSHKPELTICVFDSVSTKSEMPMAPWSAKEYAARGEIAGFNNNRINTALDLGSGILNMLSHDAGRGILWISDARQLPYWESGAPLRTILHWWLRVRGIQLLHASAVGTAREGVLLAGKSGSGKSTTALACLGSELFYAADDYCLLSAEPVPFVHSLYSSGKINASEAQKFPLLAKALSNADRLGKEKALFFLNSYFANKISKGFPLKAVLIPRVTGRRETAVSEVSKAEALKALAPSTIFQLSGAGHSAFRIIAAVTKKLPCFYLELGTDISRIPGVVIDLLNKG